MDWCPWFQFSFCKLWILDKTLGWCLHQILDDLFSPATARYLLVEAPAEGRKEPFWGPAEFLWDARDGFLDWRAGLVGWMAHTVSGWQRWLSAMTDWGKSQRYRQQCFVVSFPWIDLDQRRKLLLGFLSSRTAAELRRILIVKPCQAHHKARCTPEIQWSIRSSSAAKWW